MKYTCIVRKKQNKKTGIRVSISFLKEMRNEVFIGSLIYYL